MSACGTFGMEIEMNNIEIDIEKVRKSMKNLNEYNSIPDRIWTKLYALIRALKLDTNKIQEDATCWDCQYLLESISSYNDGCLPECGHTDAPDKSGIEDLNYPPEWCPLKCK